MFLYRRLQTGWDRNREETEAGDHKGSTVQTLWQHSGHEGGTGHVWQAHVSS